MKKMKMEKNANEEEQNLKKGRRQGMKEQWSIRITRKIKKNEGAKDENELRKERGRGKKIFFSKIKSKINLKRRIYIIRF